MHTEIYLDANATSAVHPEAIAAAALAMRDCYGNPSSSHATGLRAKAMLDGVRALARRVLGAGQGRLTFTSGATEGIQTAVLSALCEVRARRARGEASGDLLLYGATEHKAVPESLAHWNALLGTGLELRALPVDADGRHRLDVLRELAPRAAFVCTMAANNESGVVSDLAAIETVLRECAPAALWMVDSVQALGKLALDLAATRIDYAPFSGHKLYAPKGIGMLYVREGAPYTALMTGGGQEAGQRSGTENMSGIAALGAVLAALDDGVSFRSHAQLSRMRDSLAAALRAALPGIVFNAPFEHSLPTTLNFSVPGLAGKELLDLFDAAGVRVSAGSACSAAKAAPSYVLAAMQLEPWRCAAAVRMSFGPMADDTLIDAACERIERCGAALRASCLIPSAAPAPDSDGVVQLGFEGACTWLVLDAPSRTCAIVNPLAALAARIADQVRCQGYRVRAVIDTHGGAGGGRAALVAALGGQLAGGISHEALGWPALADQTTLENGQLASALMFGTRVLARVAHAGGASYLLGERSSAGLAASDVRFAFTGPEADMEQLAQLVSRQSIVCPEREAGGLPCTTLTAERGGAAAAVNPLATQLEAHGLERFFKDHPDALLIDVREAYEHAAAHAGHWHGRAVHSVPLSRLADRLSLWLRADERPLVFFCRSGARSIKAAQCLHRLGYRNAWHVAGGVALGGDTGGSLPLAA
ncbi:aminotransferase class V-fold PLP-dependent enzyme [Massilia antarctica]|uniref:aminotransferase class V-fold PLP-dependent enzyme n=1 Tax=Massilia antarctica TaxID=2765360 RepID=UPI0006BB571C|nr:aminotransferase class V-fold PLP-dependent enzyme [Massilia sp. H27-R4]MCY0911809.1 aminotransferase class V-fold PLP-dependent enzyme [Massilia sp. H27-R4]CUI06737.1 Cysteine desulfurase [Janthinobacterium sp. CG23_2]CUU30523.1 Cysteine desulfurase [Janthinobacterium sp. CG23_2]